ncbi:Aste57867_4084 [Aphanomyces stellatus]|uniref:Aste57867_4084 protein n=1 Tax=Aphanomyces stellatus TaxID=120398 RepID=A0A485KEW3_9STRA|nr:hypothetical protein As57867_004073 [Aphanomyces stellatus]VFT81217.1 Aste57867_4084 [Aphanomyces stellatus]
MRSIVSRLGLTCSVAGFLYLAYAAAALLSVYACGAFLVVSIGYTIYSSLLHVIFYRHAPPPVRSPHHMTIVSFNLIMAATFAMLSTELHVRGHSRMCFDDSSPPSSLVVSQAVLAMLGSNLVEYYWHRLLHIRALYVRVHKVHHHYKRPQPFDDMYMHPFEGAIYFCILYGPPFVLPMNVHAFILYMVVMGLFGVLDHSGLSFHIPLVYKAQDHAVHHAKVNVNYGFPFVYLDLVHGTFHGEFAGVTFGSTSTNSAHTIDTFTMK